MREIVGVMMVKNEERFVGAALRNIIDFCDLVIVIDTGSTDQTLNKILDAQYAVTPRAHNVDLCIEPDLTRTHRFIEPYIGTDTWIFGVDGDEIYDPVKLKEFRETLIDPDLGSRVYQIKGHYLHVTEVLNPTLATGFMGPPSHNPTKLYDMSNITKWPSDGKHSLFHPKTRVVRNWTSVDDHDMGWKRDPVRCLHMRFLRRSSVETEEEVRRRLTPEDQLGYGSRGDRGDRDDVNERRMYRRGDLVTVDITQFGELEI